MDFLVPSYKKRKGYIEVFPDFYVRSSKDLMIRGGKFYAIWDHERNKWSISQDDAIRLIDHELDIFGDELKEKFGEPVQVMYLRESSSGSVDKWKHFCEKQMVDNYCQLNDTIIFSNQEITREDYASKCLPYPLCYGSTEAYDELMSVLYSPEERKKIEWSIGAVVTGDGKWIQKFLVFVGDAGTGKSTVLNIIKMLFDGYYATIDAKALGNNSSSFALEPLRTNPLVALQDDADLSRIEDNTRLNSLVSHEYLVVNEKFKSSYEAAFHCFIFLGTNKEVMITDARSGLLRRLIDVEPTGNKIPETRYYELMDKIKFELSGIAWKCKEVYESDKFAYATYFPTKMIRATNQVYNFVEENYYIMLQEGDFTTLSLAWDLYKRYCSEAAVPYPLTKQKFKTELRAYFYEFIPDGRNPDGSHAKNIYKGFKKQKLGMGMDEVDIIEEDNGWLEFNSAVSLFDEVYFNMPAQYATDGGIPSKKWDNCQTILNDIDTSKLHYVKVPEDLIVIDFDLKDENGNKSYELNLEAANKWPKTYAELSKSEAGIHLHYLYDGDVKQLSRLYSEGIEIKVFSGNSSLRRMLTKCNKIPIATISSGLPLKEGDKMVEAKIFQNEKAIRTLIEKNLKKEYHPGTKPSIDFIFEILENAYKDGISYDVSDLRPKVLAFANNSSNHSEYCVKKVTQMKFIQDADVMDKNGRLSRKFDLYSEDAPIVFYDIEVFPNLFVVCYKFHGEDNKVGLINPSSEDIERMVTSFRLVGFNNRRYDNHVLYARMLGYSLEQLFNLSQKIINGSKNSTFSEAYNLSYTDVYDFCSAGNKMGLKKWEIKLGIHHDELGLPWDQNVPEDMWERVKEYCFNDVDSTEIVFDHLQGDWTARQILADISGLTVNDSTNSHSTRIIFGSNRHPQDVFMYRDLSKPVTYLPQEVNDFLNTRFPYMMSWWKENTDSLLPYFPKYQFENGKSYYEGLSEPVGEGGRVYAEPGMYGWVALDDVESMHPHSAGTECLFGVEYTNRFMSLLDARLAIKHENYDALSDILDGVFVKYVEKLKNGEITSGDLSQALKTVINSVYGLTSASFENTFKDPRNKDNIVAKRGALFMIELQREVQQRGFTVAHIKTDSIKIPDATKDILNFVQEFGARYGYRFEHEATYDRMTLVNDAVYIARYSKPETCEKLYGYIPKDNRKHPYEWTATGQQFQEPFVFKTLFSKEPIEFEDYFQTKNVSVGNLYLDFNENKLDVGDLEDVYLAAIAKDKSDEKKYKKYNDILHKHGFMIDFKDLTDNDIDMMRSLIEKEHNYVFIGKVSSFLPVKPGTGGGELIRSESTDISDKKYAVSRTKGYRWRETEVIKNLDKSGDIDISYYVNLVDESVASIEEYGDYNWFVSDEPYDSTVPYGTEPVDNFMNLPVPSEDDIF